MLTSLATTLTNRLGHKLPLLRVQRKLFYWIAPVILLAAAGLVYYWRTNAASQATAESTMQTATVRQGDLTISATGTGTLTAPKEELGFAAGGEMTVTGVYVKAGDLVQAGDLMAEVNSQKAQLDYAEAKRKYLDLTSTTAIAAAERAIADAQAGVDSAMYQLEYLISPDVLYWETEIAKGESTLRKAQAAVEESPSDVKAQKSLKTAQAFLGFAQDKLDEAWEKYKDEYVPETFPLVDDGDTDVYLVPTDMEIKQARLAIGDAKTKLKESQELYDVLTGDPMPEDTSNAALIKVKQAKSDLETAQARLDGTKIVAPFAGTVMQVNAAGGDTAEANATDSGTVNASTVVVVADTSHPYLEVYWDESDWNLLKVGNAVEITFDDLPDQVFSGKVTELDSGVYASGSTTAIRGEVSLDSSYADLNLPVGASASVEAISQRAANAIYIPVEALHETSADKYAVFVLVDGKPKVRVVEVGLKSELYAQVTSGLEPGEIVTTGLVKTK